jgi:hypothetical protein
VSGPLSQVLNTFDHQVRSVGEISRLTGLSRDVVTAAVDHLVATGRLRAEPLASGCPAGACGGCALASQGCQPARRPARGRTVWLADRPGRGMSRRPPPLP